MSELKRSDPVVFHFRLTDYRQNQFPPLPEPVRASSTQPKAGATVVFLPRGKTFGLAMCCEKDLYCKRWGRQIAEHRAKDGARIRHRRFISSKKYDGPLRMELIREIARNLVYEAATAVDNPVRDHLPIKSAMLSRELMSQIVTEMEPCEETRKAIHDAAHKS